MKTTFLHTVFLLVTFSTFGQKTQLLKSYDFDAGGYYLLGVFSESDQNSLRDSMGEFYTDEVSILNEFKKDWTFTKPGKKYACGYHYTVFVCRQGEILESFSINLNCDEIVTDKGYFYFDTDLLRQFYGKLKEPYSRSHSFKSIEEAREFRKSILTDSTLIMAPSPLWVEYEGSFAFTYNCKEGTKDCLDKDEKIFRSIEAEIKTKFPDEKFILYNVGGSWTTISLKITSNKSLSNKFHLYIKDHDCNREAWHPFDLSLRTFWKTRKK